MGAKYTEGQQRASAKYLQGKHQVRLIIPEEDYQRYKGEAAKRMMSVNQFIVECIEKEM